MTVATSAIDFMNFRNFLICCWKEINRKGAHLLNADGKENDHTQRPKNL